MDWAFDHATSGFVQTLTLSIVGGRASCLSLSQAQTGLFSTVILNVPCFAAARRCGCRGLRAIITISELALIIGSDGSGGDGGGFSARVAVMHRARSVCFGCFIMLCDVCCSIAGNRHLDTCCIFTLKVLVTHWLGFPALRVRQILYKVIVLTGSHPGRKRGGVRFCTHLVR